ncbi:ATP synthase subunit delta, chloroplastic-like [Prosopis cineraria]|uniref:ATP synthase subunit delta, chloroplastic-like n=1 Tax=Prosopis cineraria TaxID=364024 RepID=UPI00240FD66F|nr:ATP synthase subunit delta, chloroplastic-like [Prosopis cineraria]
MASLQASLRSNHIHPTQIPRSFLTQNPLLKLSFSGTNFPSLKLKFPGTATSRRSNGALGAKMSATAAASYALALADVAKANNTLDDTASDIEKIEEVFSDPQVFGFFSNPTIDLENKRKVVEEIAASSSLQPHTLNFLNILVDAKRIDLIKDIAKEYEFVYNDVTNTEPAIVSSVVKLESEQLSQIAKQVQKLTGAKNVKIKSVIDPSLVAGFTVRYGNSGSKLIDMSVKKQLEDIAAQLDLGDITLTV